MTETTEAPARPGLTPDELKAIREDDLEMTQVELAYVLDLSPTTVARWEQGARAISMPTVVALALETLIGWQKQAGNAKTSP